MPRRQSTDVTGASLSPPAVSPPPYHQSGGEHFATQAGAVDEVRQSSSVRIGRVDLLWILLAIFSIFILVEASALALRAVLDWLF
jgi:hypothetical protein